MNIGRMDHFIKIVLLESLKDDDGFSKDVYNTVLETRAYREGRHGSRLWANRAAFSDATDMFLFRNTPGTEINTNMVLIDNGHKFSITSVEYVKGRQMYVEVLAKEVI